METAEYWLMTREYGIWNAAITSLQFWAEDLDPVTLGIASEHVYNHFFWDFNLPHPTPVIWRNFIWTCFVLALNAAFTQQLLLADEGYESGSNEDLPMPLRKMPCIHHVSSMEHASFDPAHSTPHWPVTSASDLTYTPTRPVCCTAYPSVVTVIQWTLHIVPVIQPQNPLTSRMRTSRQYPWMMNIGQQKWFQKEHSAYMRMDYLIMCAHTHALVDIMALHLVYR